MTLAGDRHAARMGTCLLARLGLRELIAADEAEYLEIAMPWPLTPAAAPGCERNCAAASPLRPSVTTRPSPAVSRWRTAPCGAVGAPEKNRRRSRWMDSGHCMYVYPDSLGSRKGLRLLPGW
ncbi:MAG: hypothetical protein WCJ64_12245, partial [Rhodospirillaceae bacterium]